MAKKKNNPESQKTSATRSTVNAEEVAQFNRLHDTWWDPLGPMAPLHRLNPVRMDYILVQARQHLRASTDPLLPLQGLHVADVGCGGGLVAEALCRLGARVTAIDAGSDTIAAAQSHARNEGLEIDYRVTTVEDLAATRARFDLVTALEIVEHVDNRDLFISSCAKLVKPDGLLIMSTLNRTLKSFALGIVAAEYVLRWLEPGTHDWHKFVKPSELARSLRACSYTVTDVCGLVYRPLDGSFALDPQDIDVNYLISAKRS